MQWKANHTRARMVRLAVVLCAVAGLGSSATPAVAQEPVQLTVYHGLGSSQIVSVTRGGEPAELVTQAERHLSVEEGTRVCVRVMNAHPALFSYKLTADADSTPPTPPDGGVVVIALAGALSGAKVAELEEAETLAEFRSILPRIEALSDMPEKDARLKIIELQQELQELRELRDANKRTEWLRDAITQHKKHTDTLARDIDTAHAFIAASARPEDLLPREDRIMTGQPRGFQFAQESIARLPTDSGRFNDPNLAKEVERWRDEALATLGDDPDKGDEEIINALHAQALTLLSARDAIRDAYAKALPVWTGCQTVKNGKNTLVLRTQPTKSEFTTQRDTGSVVKVVARSRYPRAEFELVPLAFGVYVPETQGFALVGGNVVEGERFADDFSYRVGTMLTVNPRAWRFGDDGEFGIGVGLGIGLFAADKVLSDFLVGPLFSWRDWVRIGVGAGWSAVSTGLKAPALPGSPLPDDFQSLEDAIEKRRRGALYTTFTLTGLKLGS